MLAAMCTSGPFPAWLLFVFCFVFFRYLCTSSVMSSYACASDVLDLLQCHKKVILPLDFNLHTIHGWSHRKPSLASSAGGEWRLHCCGQKNLFLIQVRWFPLNSLSQTLQLKFTVWPWETNSTKRIFVDASMLLVSHLTWCAVFWFVDCGWKSRIKI